MKYGESKLEGHGKMLRWIEHQRKEMVAEQVAPVHAIKDHDRPSNVPTPTCPGRRKRRQRSRSPFRPVRSAISKKPSREQGSLRPSKHDTLQTAENAAAATKPPRRSKRIADLKDKSSLRDIESTPFRRPQCVARAKVAHPRKCRQPTSVNINRSTSRKVPEQPSFRVTKRCGGRKGRKLPRLGFELAM